MLLERKISTAEMLDWLQAEAQARNANLTLFRNDVEERTEQSYTVDGIGQSYTFVGVRVRIENEPDLGKEIHLMVELQEAWNNREPRPDKLLHLIPAGVPQGVW